MRIILTLCILGIIVFTTGAYGQTASDFGYRFLPNKIIENTDAILQVYSNGDAPKNIDDLVATSSDSTIVKILNIEQNPNDFITYVKIHAGSAGTANIALAAPGFSSQEIPITVYSDNNVATKLFIKTTPSTFSTTDVEQGYVTVELANNAGIPMNARQDTRIVLSTSDSDIISLENTELTIKEGQYFAIGQFEVKKDGTAQIYASAASMSTVSSVITISTTTSPQTIQAYVYPSKMNNFQNSDGYIVVQLHDASGNPVLAKEDIPVSVQIVNASKTLMVNTSGENPLVSANELLVIKKGSYWGYTPINVNAGLERTYEVDVSAKGYLISQPPPKISTVPFEFFADNSAKIDPLPILATGQKELVGILHLEDNNNNPVMAADDLSVQVDSSDPKTLSIYKVIMSKGFSAALVFGQVGTTIPTLETTSTGTTTGTTASTGTTSTGTATTPVTLTVLTENVQTLTPTMIAPVKDSFALVADPLITAVSSDDHFPLALYMTKNGQASHFLEDVKSLVTPTDLFQTEPKMIHKGDSVVRQDSKSLKDGSIMLTAEAGDFSTNFSIQSLSSKPATIMIDYPDKLFSNLKNTFSIQLLDNQQNPIFLGHDTQFQLISSDPSVLQVPQSIVIKNGNYYQTFDAQIKNAGKSELAVLSSELPLAKFDVEATSLTPSVAINSNDYVNPNFTFDATVTAQYNNNPLSGLKVDWNVQGAKTQSMDSVTDKDGKAKISLVSEDPNKITIQASVTGGIYSTTTISKDITVNPPLVSTAPAQNTNSFSIMGINPLFIIIPGAAAASGIILKKKNMLDGMTEKMNFGEKFSTIKERISEMREK